MANSRGDVVRSLALIANYDTVPSKKKKKDDRKRENRDWKKEAQVAEFLDR